MVSILVIAYSQSGEVARAVRAFAAPLQASGARIDFEEIRPRVDYPYPWRSLGRFFDAMPESVLGLPPEIETPRFDPEMRYDLVVLAYPVWFLSPALPIQGFLSSRHASVLRGADVLTLSVSRAMWQQASLTMKRLLAAAGARHVDGVVVTHQGSPILTLVSTPRALLFGRSDQFLGMFPKAGVAAGDMERLERLGATAAKSLSAPRTPGSSLLAGEPALAVRRWLVVPELLASYCFRGAARVVRSLGEAGPAVRRAAVYGFAVFLVLLIVFGLPIALLGTLVGYPLLRHWLNSYAARLAAPTGEPPEG